jgi:hypothetical protein
VNAHERQQFDMLLQLAVERYAERLVQRNDGPERAHARLRDTPDAEGVWLPGFVDAVFQDSLVDNTAGACFVLEALERRPAPAVSTVPSAPSAPSASSVLSAASAAPSASSAASVAQALAAMARAAFADLLQQKTLEELDRRASYQAVQPAES